MKRAVLVSSFFVFLACQLIHLAHGNNAELQPGTNFTGYLEMCSHTGEVLSSSYRYDLVTDADELYDSDDFSGLDTGNAEIIQLKINLTQPWSVRYVRVKWTAGLEPSSSTGIYFERYDTSESQTIGLSEMTLEQGSGPTGDSWYSITYTYDNTNDTTELFTDFFLFWIAFGDALDSQKFTFLDLEGVIPTSAPTMAPTSSPTTLAPTSPSSSPTISPTKMPTILPTVMPTNHPTFPSYLQQTESFEFTQSKNVYPLSERNMTYSTYSTPSQTFEATAILAWGNIDATVWVEGCEDSYDYGTFSSDGSLIEPGEFYYCQGEWVLETSASLITFQQTYGRLEIWEVDDYGRKYRQIFYEFEWNTTDCTIENYIYDNGTGTLGDIEDCEVLPLTEEADHAAMFRFTMPKVEGDNRRQPLIVVWYDLLAVPYSLRPVLNETYWNFTFTEIDESYDLSLETIGQEFAVGLVAAGVLLIGFVALMIRALFVADDTILKQDYMLDTRQIRTTYIHSVTTLIAPQSELQSRSEFSIKRHGWWLMLVIVFRVMFMAVFTFTFFGIVFLKINEKSFNVLDQYSSPFASERDSQLANKSAEIESYYNNETARMESEVDLREYWCYEFFMNETKEIFDEGSSEQYANHSTQMQYTLNSINLDNLTSGLYISGLTACNLNTSEGATILSRDPLEKIIYDENGDYLNTTYLVASKYDRSFDSGPYNFSYFEEYMTSLCEITPDCVGWTFIDEQVVNTTNETQYYETAYYMLSSLADPVNGDLQGLCYAMSFDSSIYDFSSVNALANYTSYLENLYLSNYVSDVGTLYDYYSDLWDSMNNLLPEDNSSLSTVDLIVNTDATDFDVSFKVVGKANLYDNQLFNENNTYYYEVQIYYDCPGCPTGNITNAYLQTLVDFVYSYNYTNFSDFVDEYAGNSSFSDYLSIDTAWIDYPEISEIEMPFDIDIDLTDMKFWSMIEQIFISLDVLLLIYRWYRTVGMVAIIVRGKDVQIRLKYLQTEVVPPPPCCSGQQVADKALNGVIWCHDTLRNCSYNLWKFMFWIWTLLKLTIVLLIILALYVIIDNVLTQDFFVQLGAFDLLTVAIAAQRSIRNEVICTAALSYNNYTLELLEHYRDDYAEDKNDEAVDWNRDELERVDEYNAYFCDAYTAYQANSRDVTYDCGCNLNLINIYYGNLPNISTNYSLDTAFGKALDGDATSAFGAGGSWLTSDTDLWVEIELPAIDMTNTQTCYWEISQLTFAWKINSSAHDSITSTEFQVWSKLNDSEPWETQNLETSKYTLPTSDETTTDELENNVAWTSTTRYVLIKFENYGSWNKSLSLAEIEFAGHAEEDCIACDTVTFYYWDFDAYETEITLCPDVTPVHGIMYRGWVRTWLNDQLIDAHLPFIDAIRTIALSPFFILLVGAIVLIVVYILAFIVESILIKVNMYRENPYAVVPLVHANQSELYDPSYHDVDDLEKHADQTTYFGNTKSQTNFDKNNSTSGSGNTSCVAEADEGDIEIDYGDTVAEKIASEKIELGTVKKDSKSNA